MENLSFGLQRASGLTVEIQVQEVNYEFSEVKLPCGDSIAIGIEKDKYGDFVNISMRDLVALRDLQKYIINGTYKIVKPRYTRTNPLNKAAQLAEGDNTITVVESQMKINHKMIAIAKPEINGQLGRLPQLSEDDVMFLFHYLYS